ncbi:MAG: Gfo/Idh/MocA family oxidoreductase [Candidatus Omnitrophica bacterium]|nr:Gfo/Idh/MocA family oxidoreductase [Candidatus Omnitrophota bacterium]
MFKVGIVGCGHIASTFDDDPMRKYVSTHIGAYRANRNTDVVAVCDIDRKKLRACMKKWDIKSGYTSVQKMLDREKIDILSICTPVETHGAILRKAVNFPLKAIFCEKPLADSTSEAKKIVNICKRKKIILQVNHQRRFDQLHARVRDVIRYGKLGDVQQVTFYYTAGIKNTGSHMFDLFLFLFGKAKEVMAFSSTNRSHKFHDPNLDGFVRFENGILGVFQACDAKKYVIFELNCLLQEGRIVIRDSGFSVDFYVSGRSKYFAGYRELLKAKPHLKVEYKRDFMVKAVRHLVDCVKKSKEPISSGNDGVAVLELIEAASSSAAKNGKKILLK